MTILLSSLSFSDSRIEPCTFAPTIVRNEHSALEDMNRFCRFLLKCGAKPAEETTSTGVQHENYRNLKCATMVRPEGIPGKIAQAAELEDRI
jgi:hypothetical protein